MKANELKTGDVLLIHNPFKITKPLYYLSAVIRVFSKCRYNHAAIILVEDGIPYVVEAVLPRVIKTPLSEWIDTTERDILVQRRNIDNVPESVLSGRIKRQIGKPYDTFSLCVHLPAMMLSKWIFGSKIWTGKTELEAIKKVYCYEVIANVYREFYPNWWMVLPSEQLENPNFENQKLIK